MKAIRTPLQIVAALALISALFVSIPPARASGTPDIITVDSAADALTGLAGSGTCELREAIEAANTNAPLPSSIVGDCAHGAGSSASDPDVIQIKIGTGGTARTISLVDILTVTDSVEIDGSAQGSMSAGPLITITGGFSSLLYFDSGSAMSTVKYLRFNNVGAGTDYASLKLRSSYNTVVGNYFNTDGTTSTGNRAAGVWLDTDANIIGGPNLGDRNFFGGLSGLEIYGGTGNTVENNYFGVGTDGSTALTGMPAPLSTANSRGIRIGRGAGDGASQNIIRGNVIGGFTHGVELDGSWPADSGLAGTVHDNFVVANKIGVDAAGAAAIPNQAGLHLFGASANYVGGVDSADRNVISGNVSTDVYLNGDSTFPADGNQILGNYVGLNADGTGIPSSTSPNLTGIHLAWGTNNTVKGNVISGHSFGLLIYEGNGLVVHNNKIGTNAAGTAAIPNLNGIELYDSASIGEETTAGNNLISGNTGDAVFARSGVEVGVYGNQIGVDAAGTGSLPNGNGIELASGASGRIVGNWIANSTYYGVNMQSVSSLAAPSPMNCFTGNYFGVYNWNPTPVDFTYNWWNDPSGPTPSGTGDRISGPVTVDYFLTSAPAACSRVLSLGSTSLDFGSQLVGSKSGEQQVNLSNSGGKPVTLSTMTASGPFSADGSLCPTPMVPGDSCKIIVTFSPVAVGAASGTLTITSDAGSGTDTLSLTGTGVAGTQLLKNGSFEADANHDNKPDKFVYSKFNVLTDARDCTVHKSGPCSLKLAGNRRLKTATQTVLKTGSAGDDVVFSLWSKASRVPAGSTYSVQVQFMNGTTPVGSPKILTFATGTHGFVKATGTLSAADAYTSVVFKISFQATRGNVWFDVGSLYWAP